MVFNLQVLGFAISLIWLSILSFFFWQLISHYNKLSKGISNRTLKSILDDLLNEISVAKEDIAKLRVRCDTIEKEGQFHIQKIGLTRFNPFKDTGGDQSFILAILDKVDSGVIISGLYSRSGTRWYAKKVRMGKSLDHEFSDDEKKALKEAKAIA